MGKFYIACTSEINDLTNANFKINISRAILRIVTSNELLFTFRLVVRYRITYKCFMKHTNEFLEGLSVELLFNESLEIFIADDLELRSKIIFGLTYVGTFN